MASRPCIGIDLGTTYSCVGVFIRNKVEMILNEQGSHTTPSCVSFSDVERLIGEAARSQGARNPNNTIFEIKRLIGRKYDDPTIQDDLQTWPFEVNNEDGEPVIKVMYQKRVEKFNPEDISAMVLSYMKKIAEIHLKQTVEDVVITVPAYFNDSQRQATIDAGRIAGLNVLRIINEPTAAALAYGFDKLADSEDDRNVLVFDLGGGTFDVSLLTISKGSQFTVKATNGDMHLGGMNFDSRMVSHFLNLFKTQHDKDPSSNHRAMFRLREACEKAKRILSTSTTADITLDGFYEGESFYSSISEAKFSELCMDLFKKCLPPLEQVLKDAKMTKNDVHDIVMVGGSTRIPKIRRMVQGFFNGKELTQNINPDEAVGYGAALQAALLSNNTEKGITDIVMLDLTPMSLGVAVRLTDMSTIIKRNTHIPCSESDTFTTFYNNQTDANFIIYEGEMPLVKDNYELGSFTLQNIENAPRGIPQFETTFSLDENGILKVSAVDKKTGSAKEIQVKLDKGRLSEQNIRKHILTSERFQSDDRERLGVVDMRNRCEGLLYRARRMILDKETKKSSDESVLRFIDRQVEWLNINSFPSLYEIENVYNDVQKTLKNYKQ